MSIASTHNRTSISTFRAPVRLARGSRPGWRQTGERYRARVPATAAAPWARATAGEQPVQLALFDTTPYRKGVGR